MRTNVSQRRTKANALSQIVRIHF